jgi:hypothetical protein
MGKGGRQSDIHNPHDTGYKYLLLSKKMFIQLLRSFVKEEWVDMRGWDT